MKMNGEHLGTGAGAGLTSKIRIWDELNCILCDNITFDRTEVVSRYKHSYLEFYSRLSYLVIVL